jgi:hypothetical protein
MANALYGHPVTFGLNVGMKQKQNRDFEVVPRPRETGGWTLILLESGDEAGSSVFPLFEEPAEAYMVWCGAMKEEQRRYWQIMAASGTPADARRAYLLAEAYADARQEGRNWINPPSAVESTK